MVQVPCKIEQLELSKISPRFPAERAQRYLTTGGGTKISSGCSCLLIARRRWSAQRPLVNASNGFLLMEILMRSLFEGLMIALMFKPSQEIALTLSPNAQHSIGSSLHLYTRTHTHIHTSPLRFLCGVQPSSSVKAAKKDFTWHTSWQCKEKRAINSGWKKPNKLQPTGACNKPYGLQKNEQSLELQDWQSRCPKTLSSRQFGAQAFSKTPGGMAYLRRKLVPTVWVSHLETVFWALCWCWKYTMSVSD